MQADVILVRVGEIHLKGLNRPFFEQMLIRQVRMALEGYGVKVERAEGRLSVKGFDPDKAEEVLARVCRVFGVYSVSAAREIPRDMDSVRKAALEVLQGRTGTFKIFARRADKRYPMDSMAIGADVGGYILENVPGLKVDVKNPQHRVSVEIREQIAYVYEETPLGVGGMPIGTGGKGMLLLSGGIDSPVAGWMCARRGTRLEAVHFESPPYTSARSLEKVIQLANILSDWTGPIRVHVVPFTQIQMAIHDQCPDGELTLLMRRFMMRIASRLARKQNCGAIITGESLGQVASQTIDALGVTDDAADMPVFRPLISFDKVEIMDKARQIGTYETSILPFEDCCTVFVPRHPVTRPQLDKLRASEAKLDVQALEDEAIANTKQIWAGRKEAQGNVSTEGTLTQL